MLAKGISNLFKMQVNAVKGKNNSKCIAVNTRFSYLKRHIYIEDLIFRHEKGEKLNKTQSYDTFF